MQNNSLYYAAYIIGPLRQGIPLEVLHLIEHDARLTSLQVDKMPDESNSVCNLEVLQPNYTVLVDLSVSPRHFMCHRIFMLFIILK